MVAPRLHVVGSSPRSGTTLMFEVLLHGFELMRHGTHEVSLFDRPLHAPRPYASKKPNDLVHLRRVLPWDRALYAIYMDRDPRDIIVSRHGSAPDRYWCDFPIWDRNNDAVQGLTAHPRVLICRYEDLTRDPDGVQARIAAAFPFLTQTRAFSTFGTDIQMPKAAQLALKGVRRISPDGIGGWRDDLPRIAAQLRDHPRLAQAVVEAGYEDNPDWVDVCDEVTPDPGVSVRAAHDPLRGKAPGAMLLARGLRRGRSFGQEARYALSSVARTLIEP